MGLSYIDQTPVSDNIMARLPNTLLLTGLALLLSLAVAVPLGVISAVRRHSWIDNLATVLSTAGTSIPSFWFGLMAILIFAVELGWLPSGGMYTLLRARTLPELAAHQVCRWACTLSSMWLAGALRARQ